MSTDAHHALLPQDAGIVLLPLARVAIAQEIGRALPAPEERPWLREPGACFITLIYEARLRGCIGTLEVEISLLSALEPLVCADEKEVLGLLRPGVDGIIFHYGHHKSTFLPQVWSDFAYAADFMAHLKYKAGLPPDFWDPQVKLYRYTVTKWRESELCALMP